ncbi:Glutathione S-transferase [Macleaya cordata]|uniref:Glutathione S-transferase n=1 Tax=Macleaya cordata TaxID=56857 RepID=A0A200RBA5_MACCD|nr:Glutathione S-transferase [Macleaya cordata]
MPTAAALLSPTLPLPNISTATKKRTFNRTRPKTLHVSPRISLNKQQQTPTSDPLTAITKVLWGKSLPPQLLISTVRSTWNSIWHLMMNQLAPSDPSGFYSRPHSQFRANFKSFQPSSSSRQKNTPNLHLYVGLPCPWAHRTLIVRALKNLEEIVPVSIASPGIDGSWEFHGKLIRTQNREDKEGGLLPGPDYANGCKNLKEVYRLQRGSYNGRSTVPMLWDVDKKEVFCNESYDIIEFFNSGINRSDQNEGLNLSPPSLTKQIEEWNRLIYPNVNNGVYRCGFAQSQEAYDTAVNGLFSTLDTVDDHLGNSRYLCGDVLTLSDICLFTTLIRFDLVYNIMFKCTKKKLLEYSNLHGYMRDIYQIPKVAATCNFEAIMDGYYKTLFPLNPGSIRPTMPSGCEHEFLSRSHDRESISYVDKHIQVNVS